MSHLKHFGIGNFKIFNELTQFELAPITILTGKNNSGKSSVIKSMLLLKNNVVEKPNLFRGCNFEEWEIKGSELKLGSPEEIFNYSGNSKTITFIYSLLTPMFSNGQIKLSYNFHDSNETFQLHSLKIFNDKELIVEYDLEGESFDVDRDVFFRIDFQYFIDQIKFIIGNEFINENWVEVGTKLGLYKYSDSVKKSDPFWKIKELLDSNLVILGLENPMISVDLDLGGENICITKEELIRIQNQLFETYKHGLLINKSVSWATCINSFLSTLSDLTFANMVRKIINNDNLFIENIRPVSMFKNSEGALYLEPKLHFFFEYIKTFFINLFDEFQREFTNIVYLPSIRARNERLYMVSKEGYAIQEIDQKLFENIEFDNATIKQFYHETLRDFEIGEDIEVNTFQRTATEISVIRKGRKMLLSDLGFGYAQIFPIIINILNIASIWPYWKYKEKEDITDIHFPKIFIEEPESNLHPDFQSKLADLFVKASNLFGIQFIIETHSEYLIRRLQYLTARKDIKPRDISIYYFYNPDKIPPGEKQINKLEISSDGNLSQDFGPGFYDEAITWKFELLKLKNAQNN